MNVRTKKTLVWIFAATLLLGGVAELVIQIRHRKPLVLRGAVTVKNSDARKEVPVADVEVSVSDQIPVGSTKTDASGFFSLTLPWRIRRGHSMTLKFRHPDYQSLDQPDFVGDQLYVAHLTPRPRPPAAAKGPERTVGNIK